MQSVRTKGAWWAECRDEVLSKKGTIRICISKIKTGILVEDSHLFMTMVACILVFNLQQLERIIKMVEWYLIMHLISQEVIDPRTLSTKLGMPPFEVACVAASRAQWKAQSSAAGAGMVNVCKRSTPSQAKAQMSPWWT